MTRRPERLVLLGHPLTHSLSPRIQNAALRSAGMPIEYEALDLEPNEIPGALEQLRVENAAGNVTIPYKERIAASCVRRSVLADRAGAVNTFWFEADGVVGDNTDVAGFELAIAGLLGQRPEAMVIGVLGAGGGAAAVLTAIEGWPRCRALVHNRTPQRADALCARFSSVAQSTDVATIAATADLVVNATSVGLRDDTMPITPTSLQSGASVFDLVYRPEETAWVRACRAAGHRAADGLAMLVEQGAVAFERWFGFEPDREAMWRAIR